MLKVPVLKIIKIQISSMDSIKQCIQSTLFESQIKHTFSWSKSMLI